MPNRPTPSDVYDINQKTGALILGKNRLEEYATKYLTHHCKEALETPMPLSEKGGPNQCISSNARSI